MTIYRAAQIMAVHEKKDGEQLETVRRRIQKDLSKKVKLIGEIKLITMLKKQYPYLNER